MVTRRNKDMVVCTRCGKEMHEANGLSIPPNYVWRGGKVVCWGCIKSASKDRKVEGNA